MSGVRNKVVVFIRTMTCIYAVHKPLSHHTHMLLRILPSPPTPEFCHHKHSRSFQNLNRELIEFNRITKSALTNVIGTSVSQLWRMRGVAFVVVAVFACLFGVP